MPVERSPQVRSICPQCEQSFKVFSVRERGARCDRCLHKGLRGWLMAPFLIVADVAGVISRVWDQIRDTTRKRK